MDDLFSDFKTPDILVDRWLGTDPHFSQLGKKIQIIRVKHKYRGFGEQEELVITREVLEKALNFYKLGTSGQLPDGFGYNTFLNETNFTNNLIKLGFTKTLINYFFNKFLMHGGYDGSGVVQPEPKEKEDRKKNI